MSAATGTRTEAGGHRKVPIGAVLGGIMLAAILLAAVLGAQAGRKASGVVVIAATEQPLANAQVQYEEGGAVQTTVTDAKGQFTIPNARQGVVTVTARGFATARRKWPPRRDSSLRIALEPPVTVAGTLVDSVTLRPLTGVVTLLVRHPANVVSTTDIVEDGTFRIEDLPPGPGLLVGHADGYAPAVSTVTLTKAGDQRDAHLRLSVGAEATGHVLDSASNPVSGARLIVSYANTLAGAGILVGLVGGHQQMTALDGTFAIEGLVPHTPVTVYAAFEQKRTNRVTLELGPGMAQDDILLRLP